MDQDKEVELMVRKVVAQEIGTHREFLQSQFKHIIWVIGIVIGSGAIIFTFIFGRTIDSTKEDVTKQIQSSIVEYRIATELKEKVNEMADAAALNAVEKVLETDETQTKINKSVRDQFDNKVADLSVKLDTKVANLAKMVEDQTKSLAVSVKNDFKNDVNKLVQAALANAENSSSSTKELLKSTTFPSGAVLAFSLPECPTGWSSFDEGAGRVILGVGKGEGLTERKLMEKGGKENHQLTIAEMPKHKHVWRGVRADRMDDYGFGGSERNVHRASGNVDDISEEQGGDQPHNNMSPFIALRFCQKD